MLISLLSLQLSGQTFCDRHVVICNSRVWNDNPHL